MEILRKSGWEGRLSSVVLRHLTSDFVFGETDCAMFTAACVHACTGVDLSLPFRGYSTELGGLRKVRKAGFTDHVDVFATALDEVDTCRMTIGDVAVVEQNGEIALGIFDSGVHVMSPEGLRKLPVSHITRGFKV